MRKAMAQAMFDAKRSKVKGAAKLLKQALLNTVWGAAEAQLFSGAMILLTASYTVSTKFRPPDESL
jgi:hypothetical protein